MCELELDYICTYKMITEDDDDEKGLRELMYKIQYLHLFGLTEYDENVIHQKLEMVYNQLNRKRRKVNFQSIKDHNSSTAQINF